MTYPKRTIVMGIACLAALLAATSARANERYDAWQKDRPFVQATFPNEFGGAKMHLEEFKASGLNTVMDLRWLGSQGWPVPESYDLPLIYLPYSLSGMDHFMTHWKEARAKHSNMIGILLGDELAGKPADEIANIRKARDWIVKNKDKSISSLIVIDSEAAGDMVSAQKGIQDGWDKQVKALEPDVWLAQFYPVGGGKVIASYYSSLEWYFNWAKKNDVAMWCWLDAFSSSEQSIPCEVELRLQRFTSLAYGVRGFADFLWCADGSGPSVKGGGYWDGSGTPTQMYRDLSVINREVANVAQGLIRLTPVRAYHMDSRDDGDGVRHWSDSDADLPTWLRRTGKLVNVTGIANANHLLVGFFRDAAGQEYFMVVNKDVGKNTTGEALATDVLLSFHPSVSSVKRLGRTDGKVETLPIQKNQLTVRLPGGTGELFKFDDGGFAGVENVVVPRLASSAPATTCRLGGNRLEFTFDGYAGNVTPVIRDAKDKTGADLAAHFSREISEDGKTLVLTENGSHLRDDTKYEVELKWSSSSPATFTALRGDVNGDGKVDAKDSAALTEAAASADPARADLNDDGVADEADAALMARILNPVRFKWTQNFDSFPADFVDGQGPWVKCATFPGSILSPSWVSGPMTASPDPRRLIAGKMSAVNLNRGGEYLGSEAKFLEDGGLGVVGKLKLNFTMRVSNASYHNPCVHIFSAEDVKGERGAIGVELTGADVRIVASRGVTFAGDAISVPLTPGGSSPFDTEVLVEVDFGGSTITWWCGDKNTKKKQGPFVVPYTGRLDGLNAISVVIRGNDAAIDNIVVEGN